MKKYLLSIILITLFTGAGVAATYTIKTNSSGTVIKNQSPTAIKQNVYNTYSAGSYVQNNTVNSTYSGVVDIVMDFSGSMTDAVSVAKATMTSVVAQIPSSIQVGLRVFGQGASTKASAEVKNVQKSRNEIGKTIYKLQVGSHKEASGGSGCKASVSVTPISTANAQKLIAGMNSVTLGGSTPMVYALQEAVNKDLSKFSRNIPKKIVLITDGGENCGGDPCAFARTLQATRRDIQVDVVLVSSYTRSLNCLATATGGTVYNLSNAYELTNAMTQAIQTPVNQTPVNQQPYFEQQYEFIKEE